MSTKNSIIGWKRHLCHLSQTEHRTKDRLELGSGNLGCDEMVLGIDAPNKPRIAGAEGSEAPSGNLSFRRWVVSARFQSRAGPTTLHLCLHCVDSDRQRSQDSPTPRPRQPLVAVFGKCAQALQSARRSHPSRMHRCVCSHR